ncbi:hypothetical protein AB0G32_20885 [Streptomyces sp. NPDC023723]
MQPSALREHLDGHTGTLRFAISLTELRMVPGRQLPQGQQQPLRRRPVK